jgi:hypothetical protein
VSKKARSSRSPSACVSPEFARLGAPLVCGGGGGGGGGGGNGAATETFKVFEQQCVWSTIYIFEENMAAVQSIFETLDTDGSKTLDQGDFTGGILQKLHAENKLGSFAILNDVGKATINQNKTMGEIEFIELFVEIAFKQTDITIANGTDKTMEGWHNWIEEQANKAVSDKTRPIVELF